MLGSPKSNNLKPIGFPAKPNFGTFNRITFHVMSPGLGILEGGLLGSMGLKRLTEKIAWSNLLTGINV